MYSHRKHEYLTVQKVHGVQLPKELLLAEYTAGAEAVATREAPVGLSS